MPTMNDEKIQSSFTTLCEYLKEYNHIAPEKYVNGDIEKEKINITFQNIPLDDKKTIELFAKGNTDGIFQFESSGMIKFLKKLKPSSLNDIYAALSLYRPGPMDSIDDYIKRKEGKQDGRYARQ